MPRVIWKGAISFGLVHVPVALYPAASESGVDFDWLDRRSMDPVGYKRVNKRTGKEIDRADIVRGVKVEGGDYVVLGDDEIKAAYPRTTQTIDIEAFVAAGELPLTLLEKPYVLEPVGRSEKVYVLLREAMLAAGVVGIARVVMHSKEHLAALIPAGRALMLDTLRWASDLRPLDELALPPEGRKGAALKEAELRMAQQLIGDMTQPFEPEHYRDRFGDAVRALVARRAEAGRTERVEPLEDAEAPPSNVVDLSALLKRSLGQRKGAARAEPERRGDGGGADEGAPAARAARGAKRTSRAQSGAKSARSRAAPSGTTAAGKTTPARKTTTARKATAARTPSAARPAPAPRKTAADRKTAAARKTTPAERRRA